ncbi:MAG: hypothetical protein A3I66_01445 [Burkholderiales bacterium RIFCSPLOWO2_02_FULL_57_36]|nr:MAG: hypothetical protein A3I66_01445 [Burkholderiales bacterium RIFCSPLOWO2_02_FULL_57_36]
MLGRKQSPETIEKRIAPLRGRPLSEAHKKALGDSKRGRPRPDVKDWAPAKFCRFDGATVASIRTDRKNGLTYRAIAEKYSCSISTAHFAVNGTGIYYANI